MESTASRATGKLPVLDGETDFFSSWIAVGADRNLLSRREVASRIGLG
jgi:hypothetical protein